MFGGGVWAGIKCVLKLIFISLKLKSVQALYPCSFWEDQASVIDSVHTLCLLFIASNWKAHNFTLFIEQKPFSFDVFQL